MMIGSRRTTTQTLPPDNIPRTYNCQRTLTGEICVAGVGLDDSFVQCHPDFGTGGLICGGGEEFWHFPGLEDWGNLRGSATPTQMLLYMYVSPDLFSGQGNISTEWKSTRGIMNLTHQGAITRVTRGDVESCISRFFAGMPLDVMKQWMAEHSSASQPWKLICIRHIDVILTPLEKRGFNVTDKMTIIDQPLVRIDLENSTATIRWDVTDGFSAGEMKWTYRISYSKS